MNLPEEIDPKKDDSLVSRLSGSIRSAGQSLQRLYNLVKPGSDLASTHENRRRLAPIIKLDPWAAKVRVTSTFTEMDGTSSSYTHQDNDSHTIFYYTDDRGEYGVNFDKISGVLSLTPEAFPSDLFDSLEETIRQNQKADVTLTLPPLDFELTFKNVTQVKYVGGSELKPANPGDYLQED